MKSHLAHRACATRATSQRLSVASRSSIACARSHSSGNKSARKTSAWALKKLKRSTAAYLSQRERRDRRRQIQSTLCRLRQRLQRTADRDRTATGTTQASTRANQASGTTSETGARGVRGAAARTRRFEEAGVRLASSRDRVQMKVRVD